MAINQHWNRWIFVSVGTFFKAALSPNMTFHIEGQLKSEEGDYTELRFTGPEWDGRAKNAWHGEIEINLLVKCVKDENDMHKIYRMVGLVEAAMAPCIPIKKYGDTPNVDNRAVTIGELRLFPKLGKDINTEHYGQLVNDIPSIQSTVGAFYRTDLYD
jgi:hypothetical protein